MKESVTNVVVSGSNGRIGKLVSDLVQKHPGWKMLCGFETLNGTSELGFPVFGYTNQIRSMVNPKPNIIIDFSDPLGTATMFRLATELSIPIVVGTTKLPKELLSNMRLQTDIPVFQAYNLAEQVRIFTKQVCKTARKLQSLDDYDIDILETHHSGKKDEVSGTALNIADAINSALGSQYKIVTRPSGIRGDKEIHIIPRRSGTAAGTHTVIFSSKTNGGDSFEYTHTASSPIIFAKGAIRAAEFLLKQNPGFYSMDSL